MSATQGTATDFSMQRMAQGYLDALHEDSRERRDDGTLGDRAFVDELRRKPDIHIRRDTAIALLTVREANPDRKTYNLDRKTYRSIAQAASKIATPPWNALGEERWCDVYDAMGELGGVNPERANAATYDALYCWLPYAETAGAGCAAEVLLFGMICSYVLITVRDPGRTALRAALRSDILAQATKPEVAKRVRNLAVRLRQVAAAMPNPSSVCSERGLRITRFRLQNFILAEMASAYNFDPINARDPLIAEATAAVDGGFVDEARNVSKVYGNRRLYPLKSAWLALVLAGRWEESVKFASELFGPGRFLNHITDRVQGNSAMIADPDHWVGFSAILALDTIEQQKLREVRACLVNEERELRPFRSSVARVKRLILLGQSFSSCRDAIDVVGKE